MYVKLFTSSSHQKFLTHNLTFVLFLELHAVLNNNPVLFEFHVFVSIPLVFYYFLNEKMHLLNKKNNCSQHKHQLTTIAFLRTALEDHLKTETHTKPFMRSAKIGRKNTAQTSNGQVSNNVQTSTASSSSRSSSLKLPWFKWCLILHVRLKIEYFFYLFLIVIL